MLFRVLCPAVNYYVLSYDVLSCYPRLYHVVPQCSLSVIITAAITCHAPSWLILPYLTKHFVALVFNVSVFPVGLLGPTLRK